MRGRAYAKINLTLEVTGKRPDGYHELVSIMQTVSLFDELSLTPSDDLSLQCDVSELAGDDNLVLRAARVLGRGGHFELRKGIPIAGGMGGGSSDAALALRLLDAAYDLRLPAGELLAAAASLGSDVPFFLCGGTALVEGRGERVTPLSPLPLRWLVVLNPGVPLPTPAVFHELRPPEYATAPSREFRRLVNTLEAPAERLEPAIGRCKQRLREAGAKEVLLSGSGPTVFALCSSEQEAEHVAAATRGRSARFVSRDEAIQTFH